MHHCALLSLATFALAAAAAAAAQGPTGHVYRGMAGGSESLTTAGETAWTAGSIEARMRPLGGAAGASGLVLHYGDSQHYYLFLYSTNSSALMIYKRSGGYTLLASTARVEPLGGEHLMRAEADAQGNLRLWWDGVLEVSARDTELGAGKAGLRVWNQTVDFDDVRVEDRSGALLWFDDFEDGTASGWTAGPGWSVVPTGGTSLMPLPVIESGFEGGNVRVDFIDQQAWTVYVTPELEGTSPYRAWFYFKMSNLSAARPTNLVVQNAGFFRRPAYSYDNATWQEFPAPSGGAYSVTFSSDPVWIAHSIPYVTRHAQDLVADVTGPYAQPSVLATSEEGRPVDLVTVTDPSVTSHKYGIWLVARHHAWEASGSWIADGFLRWLVSSDRQAQSLRQKAVVHVVPIMDVDNVVLGGSGKDQLPIDFNRDWRANPHWRAVRSAIDAIAAFAGAQRYDVFIDSHCPGDDSTFLAVQPQSMVAPAYWQDFVRFRTLLVSTAGSGALPYTGGTAEWGPTYHPLWYQMSFWHQFDVHRSLQLSLTLETRTATADGYRGLAQGLGKALDLFLYRRFGNATAHSAGTPQIGFVGTPLIGAAGTALRGANLLPAHPVVVAIGAPLAAPFPLVALGGLPGSHLLIDILLAPTIASDPKGALRLPLRIPAAASLAGAQVSFQLLDLDASLTQYALPLGHSEGLTVEIAR